MAKRKERSLDDLYKLTVKLTKARLTPILEGNCQIQGPVDESDSECEIHLIEKTGGKSLVDSLAEHRDSFIRRNDGLNCDNDIENSIVDCNDGDFHIVLNESRAEKEFFDTCKTEKSDISVIIGREETLVDAKKKAHENVRKARADFVNTSSSYNQQILKGESTPIFEDAENIVKCTDTKSYCKSELFICGEQTQENHEKNCAQNDPNHMIQDSPQPFESIKSFIPVKNFNILGSQNTAQCSDLHVGARSDDIDLEESVDIEKRIASEEVNESRQIEDFRNSMTFDAVEAPVTERNVDMLSKVLPSVMDKRNQIEYRSRDLQREQVCMSSKLPGFDLDMHFISSEQRERVSELHANEDLCNAECKLNNLVIDNHRKMETTNNVTDGLQKSIGNLLDASQASLERTDAVAPLLVDTAVTSLPSFEVTKELPSPTLTREVVTGCSGNSVHAMDEVQHVSKSGILASRGNDMHSGLPTISSMETTGECLNLCPKENYGVMCTDSMDLSSQFGPSEHSAASLRQQKDAQDRCVVEGTFPQETIGSSPIVGTINRLVIQSFTKEREAHSSSQQGEDFVCAPSTDPMNFPSSEKAAITTAWENTAIMTNSQGALQTPDDPKDECVDSNSLSGFLDMRNSCPSSEARKDINQALVEVATDSQAAVGEQPVQMVINEDMSAQGTDSQLDLDEHLGKSNTEVGPYDIKETSFASDTFSEDKSYAPVLLEDDVKVCDICGDTGREDMLAICSTCNDGAEHIYCMQTMLDKVPEDNWLCEDCKSKKNTGFKRVEAPQNFSLVSKPLSSSSKKQSSNCNSHSRHSTKLDRKMLEPEKKRTVKGISNLQSSTKRRAELLDVVSVAKKQAIEVKSSQQGVSCPNVKPALSRDTSFTAPDMGRMKPSLAVSLTGNQMGSSSHNIDKSSSTIWAQSPRLHVGVQSLKNRFISVNSLTSDSVPCTEARSNPSFSGLSTATMKAPLSSKPVGMGLSSIPPSRSSNIMKLTANPKIKKDFEAGLQATAVKEITSSGLPHERFVKASKSSLLFKSKADRSISTVQESRSSLNFPNVSCIQTEEMIIGKERKDRTDLLTRNPLEKSENTNGDSESIAAINLPSCVKSAMDATCHSQTSLRVTSSQKDFCNPKPVISEEKSAVGLSSITPVILNEESTTLSGEPLPPSEASCSLSEGGIMAIKLQEFGSFEALCNSASQMSKGQSLLEMASITKCTLAADNSFAVENGVSPTNMLVAEVFSSGVRPSKSSAVFTWPSQNFLPAAGSTRCYKCKELGHSAQFCSNRSSADAGTSSLRVSALIASAARSSREISGSSSGKWKRLRETIVHGNLKAYENEQTPESLQFDEQNPAGRSDVELPGQVSENTKHKFALSSKEATDICGKLDTKISGSPEFSISTSLLGRDASTAALDPASGFCKDSLINGMSSVMNITLEVTTPERLVQTNTKSVADGKTHSAHKILIDGERPFINLGESGKLATTTTIPQHTVQPAESTVTSVRRNISCGVPMISDGSYPGTCLRVVPYQQVSRFETVKMTAFPEHNFIWQGGFEVSSKENPINYYDGIQAHASSCAAPKVLDAVKKFSCRIKLEEVPRLSAWPVQFQCTRPTDGNIALYFFAKDLESYERPYKKLLEHMLKSDFALRGNFDGVELLIFPSNQLPEKSQRWNRLFFLWGVFRERKANCIESSAYPQEKSHGQLSATSTAGDMSITVSPRALPSPLKAGFSETEIHREIEREKSTELQTTGQSASSQISSQREKINSSYPGHAPSGPSVVSPSSLERQDNSSDSSKFAQVSSHSPGRQADIENERTKPRDYDRGRERVKDVEYASCRYKDIECDKEWKLRERDRERDWRLTSDRIRDRRSLTRRRENTSCESRHSWDGRHERRHRYSRSCSRSPPRHGSRLHSPSIRMINYDRHHSRTRPSDSDQVKHLRPSSGTEFCEKTHRSVLSLRANSFNDIVVDVKEGQRKLKKSYSELYVKEKYKEHDSSGRTPSEHNISSTAEQSTSLNATIQLSGSCVPGHVQQEDQDCNVFLPIDSQVTERFFFPGSQDAGRDCDMAQVSEQRTINLKHKHNSPDPCHTDQFISSVEEDQEPPDLNAPDLELALGAKSSPKPGVLPLFAQLVNKNSTAEEPTSPARSSLIQGSEEGSTLSLSLAFPLSQKEKILKSMVKRDKTLPDSCNVNTSLLLFGSGVDS